MEIDDLKLLAYADGELGPGERLEVERALGTDPALAARLAAHRTLAARLSMAMQGELTEPVPERLVQVARTAPAGSASLSRIGPRNPGSGSLLPRWSALAASFAFGAIGAALWLKSTDHSLMGVQHGRLSARGELAQVLTDQLAGANAGARTQVGISFRDKQGQYCRTFTIRDGAGTAGLACRDAAGWSVQAVAPLGESENNGAGLRMAASSMPKEIVEAVDNRIVGEALDGAGEKRAQAQGWRN